MEHDGKESILEKTEVESDLGVHVDHKLKFSIYIELQTNKAKYILGIIRRFYTQLDPKSMNMYQST